MKPDLELVQVPSDQSFKAWSHGYPFRTVRWHFHPEYELHLVTATEGTRYVGDHIGAFTIGDLVLVGPNVPHNWISHVAPDEIVEERCLVLQFTQEFISGCMATFPEMRFLERLLSEAEGGVRFNPSLSPKVEPLMRRLVKTEGMRRVSLLVEIFELIGQDANRTVLGGRGLRLDQAAFISESMNAALQHIGRHFKRDLREMDLAKLTDQSVSAFSRAFRRHTGLTFVQYVNAMRIELACQYLTQEDLSITEICFEVGFNNVSNFNRQFLVVKGMPPSRFRGLHRKGMRLVAA